MGFAFAARDGQETRKLVWGPPVSVQVYRAAGVLSARACGRQKEIGLRITFAASGPGAKQFAKRHFGPPQLVRVPGSGSRANRLEAFEKHSGPMRAAGRGGRRIGLARGRAGLGAHPNASGELETVAPDWPVAGRADFRGRERLPPGD